MGSMTGRVLFLGGTGVISAGSVALAAQRGWEVTVLNRGQSTVRPVPDGVELISADVREAGAITAALGDRRFDAVCDFLSFTPDQVTQTLHQVEDRTDQYVFVSSASAYQKPTGVLPIREGTPLSNPYWQYSRDKAACERYLLGRRQDDGLPVTVVRPSHTYDRTMTILGGRHAMVRRLLNGDEVIVHGDGTSLWTLTHTTDFAKGFVGLLGNASAIGIAVHITSDEWLTWDHIAREIARAAGVEARIVHVPSDAIAALDKEWGDGLVGDKANCTIFDNSLIKRLVPDFICTTPFSRGAREIASYYQEHTEPAPKQAETEAVIAQLLERYRV
ncbi:MAG: NAD-dependent epimerase/dehydratase family protein [Actinobacteria bacterium]|nr:NAD-dependent epimerase/dehydratase family protein [Actinomycetota bacterium]